MRLTFHVSFRRPFDPSSTGYLSRDPCLVPSQDRDSPLIAWHTKWLDRTQDYLGSNRRDKEGPLPPARPLSRVLRQFQMLLATYLRCHPSTIPEAATGTLAPNGAGSTWQLSPRRRPRGTAPPASLWRCLPHHPMTRRVRSSFQHPSVGRGRGDIPRWRTTCVRRGDARWLPFESKTRHAVTCS